MWPADGEVGRETESVLPSEWFEDAARETPSEGGKKDSRRCDRQVASQSGRKGEIQSGREEPADGKSGWVAMHRGLEVERLGKVMVGTMTKGYDDVSGLSSLTSLPPTNLPTSFDSRAFHSYGMCFNSAQCW